MSVKIRILIWSMVFLCFLGSGAALAVEPMVQSINYRTLGLKSDGTVVATGYNAYGSCDVQSWTDIISIAIGNDHSVGLKQDGTVISIGDTSHGQCDTGDWSDIVAIGAGRKSTYGVKSDGTVVVAGYMETNHSSEFDALSNVIQIAGGYEKAHALKGDGTVISINYSMADETAGWTDIVQLTVGGPVVGLKSDGTVVASGNVYSDYPHTEVSDWSDIVQIGGGYYHTLGLKSDGTVVSTRGL